MENGANSTLFIAKVRKTDTGNYTCSIGPNDFYTINVHVLNGNLYKSVFGLFSLSRKLSDLSFASDSIARTESAYYARSILHYFKIYFFH